MFYRKNKTPLLGVALNYFLLILYFFCVNANLFFIFAFALKFYYAVDKRVESVVLADADIVADVELGASLSNQDISGQNELTVGSLWSKSL